MNTDLAIRGSLASLPDTFQETAFIELLGNHGLTFDDCRLLVERAVLDAYVARIDGNALHKLARGKEPLEPRPFAGESADQ